MIGCGLAGRARRPAGQSGLPLAAGFAWFVPDFAATGADPLGWLGAQALYLHRGPLVQLVLTYPRGRVRGRVEGATVAAGYAAAVVTPVWGSWAGTVALAACLVAGRERRMRRSALQATALLAAGAAAVALVRFAVPGPATAAATLLAYEALLRALAAGVLVGLVRWPWERAEVADLVVELGQARCATSSRGRWATRACRSATGCWNRPRSSTRPGGRSRCLIRGRAGRRPWSSATAN